MNASGQVYVANCTSQRQIISFRLPEGRKPMTITIPMGKQVPLGDMSPIDIESLLEQLGPYGLFPVDEIKRAEKKITYVFSVGKPVSANDMLMAFDRNKGLLRDEGVRRRTESAVAANSMMNTEETPLNRLEMSVEEVESGSIPSETPIAEGFRLDNTQVTSENKPPRRRTTAKPK